mgnify:CR=1 FL=1
MAVDFDGTNDYISIPDSVTMDVTGTFSLAFWVLLDTNPGNNVLYSIGRANETDFGGVEFRIDFNDAGTHKVQAVVVNSVADLSNPSYTFTPSTGVWYHMAVVDDGTNDIVYVNGVNQASAARPAGGIDATGGVFAIGAYNNAGSIIRPVDGRMEDVRLYDRNLTPAEVVILAAGYRGPLGGESCWLSMSDFLGVAHPDGTTLTAVTNNLSDLSGNGNDGVPTNSPVARASDAPSAFPMWLSVHAFHLTRDKALTGALSWVGTAVKAISITSGFTGALSFVGSAVKQAQKPVAGALSWAGALVGRANKVVAGALTFVGTLTGVLGQIVLFFATVRSLFKGHDQDDVLSAPERSRKHKG